MNRVLLSFLIALVVTLLLASSCQSNSNEDHAGEPVDDDAAPGVDDDSANQNDDTSDADHVIEQTDLGAQWECSIAAWCIDDYLNFLTFAAPWARPISDRALARQINRVQTGAVEPLTSPLPADELRAAIRDALGIGFLLDGIDERPLTVTLIGEDETSEYFEKHLLFTDPYVGTFDAIYLTPKGDGPFPAVVAIHGHRTRASIYRDYFHGNEYPAHGYAILMLTMRVMFIDPFEHIISRDFLLDGFALMGMRVYEALLGLKYLRHRPEIDDERIGLIGHSGGSSASNLTIRLEPDFAAYVSDLQIDYCEWGAYFEPYHCETIPRLFPYHLLISDFTTSSVPVKTVPYGYTDGMREIFDFFDTWLKR